MATRNGARRSRRARRVYKPLLPDLIDDFLKCRALRHAWDPFQSDLPAPDEGTRVSLRCTRCTTERHDIIDTIRGYRVKRPRYIYPAGYRLAGEDRPTADTLRVEFFHRIVLYGSEAELVASAQG